MGFEGFACWWGMEYSYLSGNKIVYADGSKKGGFS
jgi:hypothetical protein